MSLFYEAYQEAHETHLLGQHRTTYSLSPTNEIVVGDMDSVNYNCLLTDIHS